MDDPNDTIASGGTDAGSAVGDSDTSAAAAHERLDEHEEQAIASEGRLRHVEDILDRLFVATGGVYARAGDDHAKLRRHISLRDA